jgi:hypothetical protein
MKIDLSIPIYPGGYDMAKDSAQAEMDGLRYEIVRALLGYDRMMEVKRSLEEQWLAADKGYPGAREITDAQIAAVGDLTEEQLDVCDQYGRSVRHMLDIFAALRKQVVDD